MRNHFKETKYKDLPAPYGEAMLHKRPRLQARGLHRLTALFECRCSCRPAAGAGGRVRPGGPWGVPLVLCGRAPGHAHGSPFCARGLGGKHMLPPCWHVLPAAVPWGSSQASSGSPGGPWVALGVPLAWAAGVGWAGAWRAGRAARRAGGRAWLGLAFKFCFAPSPEHLRRFCCWVAELWRAATAMRCVERSLSVRSQRVGWCNTSM